MVVCKNYHSLFLGSYLTTRNPTLMQQVNFYHVYNRVNNEQVIFFERKNYIHFLYLFKK
jgi:hypothetical protein